MSTKSDRKKMYADNKAAKGGRTNNLPKKAKKQTARLANNDGKGADRMAKTATKLKNKK